MKERIKIFLASLFVGAVIGVGLGVATLNAVKGKFQPGKWFVYKDHSYEIIRRTDNRIYVTDEVGNKNSIDLSEELISTLLSIKVENVDQEDINPTSLEYTHQPKFKIADKVVIKAMLGKGTVTSSYNYNGHILYTVNVYQYGFNDMLSNPVTYKRVPEEQLMTLIEENQ